MRRRREDGGGGHGKEEGGTTRRHRGIGGSGGWVLVNPFSKVLKVYKFVIFYLGYLLVRLSNIYIL